MNKTTATTETIELPAPLKRKPQGSFTLRIILIVFIVTIVSIATFVLISINNIQSSVTTLKEDVKSLLTDIEHQDTSTLDSKTQKISASLENINNELNNYNFLRDIPVVDNYAKNVTILKGIISKADNLIKTTTPAFKKIIGSQITTTDKQNTLSSIAEHLPEYSNLYTQIEPQLIDILNDVKKLDSNYIPGNYKDTVEKLQILSTKFPETSEEIKGFLNVFPELIGSNKTTTYLLILQSTSEMRSSGGLITAVGHVTLQNGEVKGQITLEDTWNLEKNIIEPYINSGYLPLATAGYEDIYGQAYLMAHGCGDETHLRYQDLGIYPDLHLTMQMVKDYYDIGHEYDPETYPAYDHVLILDDHFAEEMITLIQPLQVEGYPGDVTAEGLFSFIKADTDSEANANNPEKKQIIQKIANAAKDKFMNLSFSDFPRMLNTIIDSFVSRDLGIASFKNSSVQNLFDKYNMSGRTETTFNGDYFQLGEAQNCAKKLNKWVRDVVTHNIDINSDGNITKAVNIKWTQPQVFNPNTMTDAQYDLTGSYIYRSWVRIIAPKDSSNFMSDGFTKSSYTRLYYEPETYYDDILNKEVNDNIISFDHRRLSENDPVQGIDLNVSYNLPSSINYSRDGEYKMLIQKHPGKWWGEENDILIKHNGAEYSTKVTLDQDKVLKFKDGVITVDNYNKSWDSIKSLLNN